VQKDLLSPSAAARLACLQGAAAAILALAWGGAKSYLEAGALSGAATVMITAAAVGCAVSYSILRGAILSMRSSRAFAVFSASPPILVLLLIAFTLGASATALAEPAFVAGIFLIAYLACGAWGLRQFRTSPAQDAGAQPLRRLVTFGVASWVPTVAQSSVLFLSLYWVRTQLADEGAVGGMAAAIALAAIAITPVSLLAPLLLKEWATIEAPERRLGLLRVGAAVFVASILFFAVVRFWGGPIVLRVFGAEYLRYMDTFVLMSLIVGAQCAARLWSVFCLASGRPGLGMLPDVCRFLLVLLGLLSFADSLADVALVWVVSDYTSLVLCAAALLLIRRRRATWS
jgi:hypothetical protein